MSYEIVKLSLSTSFGKRSNNALRDAFLRISFSFIISLMLGLLLAKLVSRASLPSELPVLWVTTFMTLISFTIMGFIGFILISPIESSSQSLYKQIEVWPLRNITVQLLRVIPYLVIWVLYMTAISCSVYRLNKSLDIPIVILVSGVVLGSLAGTILCVSTWPRQIILKLSIFSLVIVASSLLLQKSFTELQNWMSGLALLIINSQLLLIFSFRRILHYQYKKEQMLINKHLFKSLQAKLNHTWFSIKLMRNRRSVNALIFCFFSCLFLTLLLTKRHLVVSTNDVGWLFVGAILASAFACDIRGTTRIFKAPEITGLSGVDFFIKTEVLSVIVFSLLIGLPLFTIVLNANIVSSLVLLIFYSSLQTAAAMIGLLSSTYFVPQAGDVGAQLFSSMSALVLLFGLPKILHLSEFSLVLQSCGWIAIGLISVIAINLIEFQRRKNYGVF